MDKAAESVRNAIMNGIDLIREGAGIDITSATFIIQICATLFLFLIVRFKCWNIVTNFLENRNKSVQASLDKKLEAEAETERVSIRVRAKRRKVNFFIFLPPYQACWKASSRLVPVKY